MKNYGKWLGFRESFGEFWSIGDGVGDVFVKSVKKHKKNKKNLVKMC